MAVSFGANDYQSEGFKPFQNAWASAQITDYGDDVNSKGTGKFVWFEFTVLDGPDKGRTFRNWYNYEHNNEEAERIAREHLCAMARIVKVANIILPDRASDFKGKKLRVKLSQKKDEDFPSVKEYGEYEQGSFGFGDLEEPLDAQAPTRAVRDPYAQ